jgi:hypothetical protein
MFSFENCPDIEMVSNASEFLWNTLNIWDNDSDLVYCVWRRTAVSRWLHYEEEELPLESLTFQASIQNLKIKIYL